MSKKYKLAIGQTYATLKNVFRAGVEYTAEELGANVDATNEAGEAYFVEAGEAAPAKKTIAVGGKGKKADPEQTASDNGGSTETIKV